MRELACTRALARARDRYRGNVQDSDRARKLRVHSVHVRSRWLQRAPWEEQRTPPSYSPLLHAVPLGAVLRHATAPGAPLSHAPRPAPAPVCSGDVITRERVLNHVILLPTMQQSLSNTPPASCPTNPIGARRSLRHASAQQLRTFWRPACCVRERGCGNTCIRPSGAALPRVADGHGESA
jgi:hypothetical protein